MPFRFQASDVLMGNFPSRPVSPLRAASPPLPAGNIPETRHDYFRNGETIMHFRKIDILDALPGHFERPLGGQFGGIKSRSYLHDHAGLWYP